MIPLKVKMNYDVDKDPKMEINFHEEQLHFHHYQAIMERFYDLMNQITSEFRGVKRGKLEIEFEG